MASSKYLSGALTVGGLYGAAGGLTTSFFVGLAALGVNYFFGKAVEGPRLKNLQPPQSTVGAVIPKVFGVAPVVGSVIWATKIKEHKKSERAKGQKVNTYDYSGSYGLTLGYGPITRVRSIVLDTRPIYDWSGGNPKAEEKFLGKKKNGAYFTYNSATNTATSSNGKIRIRYGTEAQMPDPSEEADKGAGKVPAYLGQVTIYFEDLDLTEFNGNWPQVTCVVETPPHNLAMIASWIANQATIHPDDYDFCELAGDSVSGFVLTQNGDAIQPLNQLGLLGMCDFVERDWKVRAIKRGRTLELSVPIEDMQSHDQGSELPEYKITRASEVESPRKTNVAYIDSGRKYTNSVASAWREVDGESGGVDEVDLSNAVLSNGEARRFAEIALYTTLSQRQSTEISLQPEYSYLADGDVMSIDDGEEMWPVMIHSSTTGLFGNISFIVSNYEKAVYDFDVANSTAALQPELVQAQGEYSYAIVDTNAPVDKYTNLPYLIIAAATPDGTRFEAFDVRSSAIVPKDDMDNAAGKVSTHYGSITQFLDDPIRFIQRFGKKHPRDNDGMLYPDDADQRKVTVTGKAVIGQVLTPPAAYPYSQIENEQGAFPLVDDVNTMVVEMIYGSLDSISNDSFLYLGNDTSSLQHLVIIGREIIRYRDAEFMGEFSGRKRYRLKTFMRGLRGTEWYHDKHRASELLISLEHGNIVYAPIEPSYIGTSAMLYVGHQSNEASIIAPILGNTIKPYSPHNITGTWDGDDIVINWDYRARNNSNPEEDDTVFYKIKIMRNGTPIRQLVSVETEKVYTLTQQVEDFGEAQSFLHVEITACNDVVGDGYPAAAYI